MNHYLRHLLPTPPGATLAIPTAEDWEEYAIAVEAILAAFPMLQADVVAPAVARTRAREARARDEVRRTSTSDGSDEGDPSQDRRQPPNPAPDVAPSESLLMQPPRP